MQTKDFEELVEQALKDIPQKFRDMIRSSSINAPSTIVLRYSDLISSAIIFISDCHCHGLPLGVKLARS